MAAVLRVSEAPGCGMFWSSPLRPMNGGRRSPLHPASWAPAITPARMCPVAHAATAQQQAAVANPTHAPEHLQLHNGHYCRRHLPRPPSLRTAAISIMVQAALPHRAFMQASWTVLTSPANCSFYTCVSVFVFLSDAICGPDERSVAFT